VDYLPDYLAAFPVSRICNAACVYDENISITVRRNSFIPLIGK